MWEDILEIDKIIHEIKSKDKMSFISLGIVVVVSDSRDVQSDRSGKALEEKIVQQNTELLKFLLKTI